MGEPILTCSASACCSPEPTLTKFVPEPVFTRRRHLTHPSTPRNRLLTETVSVLQLAERTGQGVDRAYREMLRIGKEPPAFDDSGTMVRATLVGGIGNDAFVRFVNELPLRVGRDVNVLLALSHLRRRRSIDASHLGTLIQRPPVEAQQVLASMAGERLIEPSRRNGGQGISLLPSPV
ncbi:ATP-binding protein [Nonomuraea africana]|uniref:ATP-binding protein n=1 Tax=Nonomuraea africana TaxID=46171 RepID=UPI0033C77298